MLTKKLILFSFLMSVFSLFAFAFNHVFAESAVTVSVTTYFDDENQVTTQVTNQPYGTKVSFSGSLSTDSGYTFVCWIYNGVIREDLPQNYEFTVTSDTNLIGVFRPNNQFAAIFIDTNGQLIDVQYILPGGNAVDISSELLPTKPGYEIASIKWDQSLTNIIDNTVFTLQYVLANSATYSLSVTNGSGDGTYAYNAIATVVADTPTEGMYFSHWQIGSRVVSRQATYQFTVLEDVTIEAVYSDAASVEIPMVSVSDSFSLREDYLTFIGQFYLPSGFELIEFGLIVSSSTDVIDLNSAAITRYQGSKYNPLTNEFVLSVPALSLNTKRAYLVVKDASGNLMTLYNEIIVDEPSYTYATDLFFSYYIEGSSNNKALAIFNGTGASVDLSAYSVKLYANGTTTATSTLTLSGTLAHGAVYVIANASANASILAMADVTSAVTNYNGNDALELVKSSAVIDSFGQKGVDPGTAWTLSGVTTVNASLIRKSTVTSGRADSTAAFDPSLEWTGYAVDYITGLDSHTMDNMGPEGGGASATVTSIQAYMPTLTYVIGDSLNLANGYLLVFYDDGSIQRITLSPELVSGFLTTSAGSYSLTITYQSKTDSLAYSVAEPEGTGSLLVYEIYGGGGNTGATYTNDYVVLFNNTDTDINLSGYSLQYTSATGTTYSVLNLSGTHYSKTYYLISLSGGVNGSQFPLTPNQSGSLSLSATSGKIALVGNVTPITGSADSDVIDFVGYGSADDSETSPTGTLGNALSAKRTSLVDSDDNSADYAVGTPNLQYAADSLEVVSISATNLNRYYEQNDALSVVGAVLILTYNNGSTEQIALETSMISDFSSSTLGTFSMTITYLDLETTYEYYVIDYASLDEVSIHYIDLGYLGGGPGEAALIQVGGIEILIDAGEDSSLSEAALLAYLQSVISDGTIEYVIATHQDADHIGGMDVVYQNYVVETTILYSTPSSIATTLRNDFETIVASEAGTTHFIADIVSSETSSIEVASGVSMAFLDTSYLTTADANASSIVFVLEVFDTRVLFNGDAEGSQEAVYASLAGDIDIFKLGHHGAAAGTTTYLLETITPEVAIVTNGDYLGNTYSHPTYSALSRIYTYSNLVPVYSVTGGNGPLSDRMDERNGTIIVSIGGAGFDITSEYYGTNPLELSSTAYWLDASNPYSTLTYYYAEASGIADAELLKSALNDIIDNHTYLTYDNLWVALRVTDEDPANTDNVLLFYTNRSQSKLTNGGLVDEWNREHVWAQSHGIDESLPAYTDLHHIRATDVSVNGARSDLDFSNVTPHDGSTLVTDTAGYGDVLTYNYKNSSYFEPRDEIKGDVARMLFYMATRYEGEDGEPDLELINGLTTSDSFNLGDLSTLLQWHEQDPVDEREKNRNDLVYGYQYNRNPYIDHPELVDLVFGGGL